MVVRVGVSTSQLPPTLGDTLYIHAQISPKG